MQYTETIAIDRPMAVVWELVGNPYNWSMWMEGVSDLQLEGDLAPGVVLNYTWRGKKRKATVTRFIDHQEIVIKGEEPNYTHSESIVIRGMGSMTNVSMAMVFEPKVWWATALTPVMLVLNRLNMGMPMQKNLKRLRAESEKQQKQVA